MPQLEPVPVRKRRSILLSCVFVTAACVTSLLRADGPAPANLVTTGDLSQFKPTLTVYVEGKQTRQDGWWIEHWSSQPPDETTSGEIAFTAASVHGAKAVTLRKSAGIGAINFQYQTVHLQAGKTYLLSFDYLTAGGAGAAKMEADRSQKEKAPSTQVALGDTGGEWKPVTARCSTAVECEYTLIFEVYGNGSDHAVSFKNIAVRQMP